MKLSKRAEMELIELAKSESFRKDTQLLRSRWVSPFTKGGKVDVDAYLEFVTQFNEFINHTPKPFKAIIDKTMKL